MDIGLQDAGEKIQEMVCRMKCKSAILFINSALFID
jgi:hypothetical protein